MYIYRYIFVYNQEYVLIVDYLDLFTSCRYIFLWKTDLGSSYVSRSHKYKSCTLFVCIPHTLFLSEKKLEKIFYYCASVSVVSTLHSRLAI